MKAVAIAVCVMLSAGSLMAQADFFNSPAMLSGARMASLSHSTLADAYDVNIMDFNPSGLTQLRMFSISVSHSQETRYQGMGESFKIPVGIGETEVLGFSIGVKHVGYAKSRQGPKMIQYGYSVAYANEILPTFSVGVLIGARQIHDGTKTLWGVRSAVGVTYAPFEELSYAMTYNVYNNGIDLIAERDQTTMYSMNLPHSLRAGMTLRFPSRPDERFIVLDVSNEKVYGETAIRYRGGGELFLNRMWYLRVGYSVDPEYRAATFGLGVQLPGWDIDCSYSPSEFTDQALHISLSWVFRDQRDGR